MRQLPFLLGGLSLLVSFSYWKFMQITGFVGEKTDSDGEADFFFSEG